MSQAYARGTRNPDGSPGRNYWQLSPVYTLASRLEPSTATLSGTGSVSFQNPGRVPLTEVVFRLDQNRFLAEVSEDIVTSGIRVTSLTINGDGIDLESRAVSGLNSTLLRVILRAPVPPGGMVTARMAWVLEIPRDEDGVHVRQGHKGHSVFQIAQWYPRIAMYDDIGGWDVAPHFPSLEFFNPFGTFDVAIEVPAGWLVGATGVLQNPEEVLSQPVLNRLSVLQEADTTVVIVASDEKRTATARTAGSQVWRFRADSVSDFAWGASARYSWAATSQSRIQRRPLVVHAFMASVVAPTQLTREVADMIGRLSEALTPYAWDQHTLIDGPDGAMEYPMLTMSSTRASSHETVHQWFPMMIGSDETRFAFQDEGLANGLAGLAVGRPIARVYTARPIPEPLVLPNDLRAVRLSTEYGYFRGSRMIYALANIFGDEAVTEAFRAYAAEWRFKHPTPWDFMASIERNLGQDLTEFWRFWLFSTETTVR